MKSLRTLFWVVGLLAIALLVFVFDALNPISIQLDWIFNQSNIRLSKAFAMALVVGWLIGLISAWGHILRLKSERRRLLKSIKSAETEISNLRNIPIQDVK